MSEPESSEIVVGSVWERKGHFDIRVVAPPNTTHDEVEVEVLESTARKPRPRFYQSLVGLKMGWRLKETPQDGPTESVPPETPDVPLPAYHVEGIERRPDRESLLHSEPGRTLRPIE